MTIYTGLTERFTANAIEPVRDAFSRLDDHVSEHSQSHDRRRIRTGVVIGALATTAFAGWAVTKSVHSAEHAVTHLGAAPVVDTIMGIGFASLFSYGTYRLVKSNFRPSQQASAEAPEPDSTYEDYQDNSAT